MLAKVSHGRRSGMCKMEAVKYCLSKLRRKYNAFVYEQAIVSYVKAMSNVVPILSTGHL